MANYQILGDQQKLSKGPNKTPDGNPGMGMSQIMGDRVEMSRNTIQSPSSDPKNGQFQIVGDRSTFNRGPVKSIGQNELPFSARAHEQSNAPQVKKGKKR